MKKHTTSINEKAREVLQITRDEYALCSYIQYRLADPRGKLSGWCSDKKEDIAEFIGITRPGLYKMLDRLEAARLIEIDPPTGFSKVTGRWMDTESECKQSLQSGVNKVDTNSKQSLHGDVNKVTPNKEKDIKLEKVDNEGERTPPAPNSSNLKEEKKENGLVAPAENPETVKAEIPPSKKVAPKKDSPEDEDAFAQWLPSLHAAMENNAPGAMPQPPAPHFEVTAIASPSELPGVTIVEAPKIQPWEHPNPQSPKELKTVLLRYADQNPENWRDNVLESGRATNWTQEKIDECLTDFCAWQFQQDSTKGKLSQYTAGFSLWLKRQPRFEAMNTPKEGSATRSGQQIPPPNYQTQTRH